MLIDSLDYCQLHKGLRVHAYCLMTSHVHLILSVAEGNRLSDVIRDFKGYTSSRLRQLISENNRESRRKWLLWMLERAGKRDNRNSGFQLWQQHSHPIELNTNEKVCQRLNYIHNNPVCSCWFCG